LRTYWSYRAQVRGYSVDFMRQSEGWAVTDFRDSQRGDCLCGCIWVEPSYLANNQTRDEQHTHTESSQLLQESTGRIDCR